MRRLMVAGNWKMNASSDTTENRVGGILDGLTDTTVADCDILICPPFPYLDQAHRLIGAHPAGQRLVLGAQDVDIEREGAFTGAVSASMLKDLGCQYVLVGHSERRSLYGDSDEAVARKTAAAVDAGMTAIVCVGETLSEREQNRTERVIARQVSAVIAELGVRVFAQSLIAYEPVWAIGTGETATPEQAQTVHAFIRELVRERDAAIADGVRILYGGSVKGANAKGLFGQPDIDGGLIGGASLKAEDFLDIIRAA